MRVIHRVKGYAQCPTRYFHLDEYSKSVGDIVLIEAGFTKPLYWNEYNFSQKELEYIKSKKVVLLEFEEPNKYFVGDYPEKYFNDFYKILTLCPYTAIWNNKRFGVNKWQPIFFPVEERYLKISKKKNIDVLYSGHLYAKELKEELLNISKFNHVIISNSPDPIVTHKSVSYENKMILYGKSKITLVHNIIFKPYLHRIINVWRSGNYWENEAFKEVPIKGNYWDLITKNFYVPQLKSRVFEAALSKSLILCRRDDFKVIEKYFEPNKEFIYYEKGELTSKIKDVLNNYDEYNKIIENAYHKAINNYTVNSFVKNVLNKI